MRVMIIAEAGVNHNGDLQLAKRLVDVAAESGADVVKFQTFKADRLATAAAGKAEYQKRTTGTVDSQQEMLRRLELLPAMHVVLQRYCDERKIGFMSTGFDIESVDYLVGLGLRRFKIPSGEITNLPYLRHIGALGGEVILSTGMASLDEVEAAIHALEAAGTERARMTVLHCTTEYPTPVGEVNLRAMQTIADAFGVRIGYSDHTAGIEVSIAAVAMGASVIEKHFTLDRNLPGPDHQASLEPHELKALIAAVRNVELALGDGVKRLTASEAKNRPIARKSIVARRAIAAGEVLSDQNLTTKRPGTGISPMRWDDFVGSKAIRDFSADEFIEI
jgi:N,N'-diacetyllegionaminate synthase